LRSLPRRTAALALAGALAAAGIGCSSSNGPSTAAPATAPPKDITVTLSEWKLVPTSASAAAGKVTFTAKNEGATVHELVLFKTDLAADKLPVDEEGAVDERGAGIELVDEVEDVDPGTSKSFTADVAPGKYLLVCNLVDKGENHYEHKMYAALTVSGAAAARSRPRGRRQMARPPDRANRGRQRFWCQMTTSRMRSGESSAISGCSLAASACTACTAGRSSASANASFHDRQ
jgi:uncharacterized cupredoxin-like copper-binding protein